LRLSDCELEFKNYTYHYERYDSFCNCYVWDNYTISYTSKLDCVKNNVWTPWNGVRRGENVVSDKWKSGAEFPLPPFSVTPKTPGAVPIIKTECDGRFTLLPNSAWGAAVNVTFMRPVFEWVYNEIYKIRECSADIRNMKMSDSIFTIMHFLPSALLYQFTVPVPNFHLDAYFKQRMSSWLIYPDEDPQRGTIRIYMPDTCTYDTWAKTGMCSASFTGFSDLFGVDVRLNAYIKKCSSHEYPEIYVECSGADCSLLTQPKFCTGNQDCSSYATCVNLKTFTQTIFERLTRPFDFLSDWVVRGDSDKAQQCRNNFDKFVDNIKTVLGIWGKGVPSLNVCAFDIDHFFSVANNWAQTQVTQDGLYYRLTNLLKWNV